MKLFINEAEIGKAIVSAKKSGVTLQLAFHRIACSIVGGLETNRDFDTAVRLTNALIEAMPGMARVNAMKSWVEVYLGFTWNKEAKAFVFVKRQGFTLDLAGAIAEPFWELKPEPEYQPIEDFNKLLSQLLAKGKKDIEKLGKDSKVDLVKLADLEAMVSVQSKQTK